MTVASLNLLSNFMINYLIWVGVGTYPDGSGIVTVASLSVLIMLMVIPTPHVTF